VRMLQLGAAGRVEDYNDFGSTTTGKLTMRVEPVRGIAFRGALSTGFRAPSLAQSFFAATSTNFIDGIPFENRTFPVATGVAQALGAQPLKAETSRNYSFGIALTPIPALTLTADYYQILIDDRIVLSGNFTGAPVRQFLTNRGFPGVGGARFFTNAIDTRSFGFDIVVGYGFEPTPNSTLRLTAGFNNGTHRVLRIASTPPELSAFQETLFDRIERARIELGQPQNNLNVGATYLWRDLTLNARTQRFGEVTIFGTPTNGSLDQTFGAKWITDLSVGYRFAYRLGVTVGADNLFDVYPDENNQGNATTAGNNNFGIFPYNGISPFGFNGAFYYARLAFDL
jgi:iron complex outermembrane recepter protein